MKNQKLCPMCRTVKDLDTEASYIGTTEGISKINNVNIVGKCNIKYYNCHTCGTTLVKIDYPEPETLKEALDLIDTICASLEADYASHRRF